MGAKQATPYLSALIFLSSFINSIVCLQCRVGVTETLSVDYEDSQNCTAGTSNNTACFYACDPTQDGLVMNYIWGCLDRRKCSMTRNGFTTMIEGREGEFLNCVSNFCTIELTNLMFIIRSVSI